MKRQPLRPGQIDIKPPRPKCSGSPDYCLSETSYMPVTESGCWIWLRGQNNLGYPVYSIAGQTRYAHRLYYERFVRPLQPGEIVLHTCDVPSCVNPDHLRAGTMKDNTQDMIAKGRDRLIGARSGHAKLTEDQVRAIRKDTRKPRHIAWDYGISASHAQNLKAGQFWSHIT